ncbi:nuclear pore complex protein nup98-nup96 [Anaeramoeba flamelloides]|uniref:Nuclear pore complex protein nup98-nup96 n=1 Tax=Anaeramoeba flamelloides TaxID=1746091 RepID=A0AAV7YT47_9EUKA|nr:nuclear pore complex protein nup98-nup96 [Anaeramoeba flamelloides]
MNNQNISIRVKFMNRSIIILARNDINKIDLQNEVKMQFKFYNSSEYAISELSDTFIFGKVIDKLNVTNGYYVCNVVRKEDLINAQKKMPEKRQFNNKPKTAGGFGGNKSKTGGGIYGRNKPKTGGEFGENKPKTGGGFEDKKPKTAGGFGGSKSKTGGGIYGRNKPKTGGIYGRNKPKIGGEFGGNKPKTGGGFEGSKSKTGGGIYGRNKPKTGGIYGRNKPKTGGEFGGNKPKTGGGFEDKKSKTAGGFGGNKSKTGGGIYGRNKPIKLTNFNNNHNSNSNKDNLKHNNNKKNKNKNHQNQNQNNQKGDLKKIWIKKMPKQASDLRALDILVLTIKQFHLLKTLISKTQYNSYNNTNQEKINLIHAILNQIFPIFSLYNDIFYQNKIEIDEKFTQNFKFEWKNYSSENNWIQLIRIQTEPNRLIKFVRNSFAHMNYELKLNTNQIILNGYPREEKLIFSGNDTFQDLNCNPNFDKVCKYYKSNNCKFKENCKNRHSINNNGDPRTRAYKGVEKYYKEGQGFIKANVSDIIRMAHTRMTIPFRNDFINFAQYVLNLLVEGYINIGEDDSTELQKLQKKCQKRSRDKGDEFYKLSEIIKKKVSKFDDLLKKIYNTRSKFLHN